MTLVSRHTWWIDLGATTHISVSMQGCLSCRRPSDGERYIYIRDDKLVEVEAIGTFGLLLRTSYFLDLKDTYVVRLLDRIWFLFLYWTSFVIVIHLGMKNLVFYKVQIWLQRVLYLVLTIFICLIQMPHLINPCM